MEEYLISIGIVVLFAIGSLMWIKLAYPSRCKGKVERINKSIQRDKGGDTMMYSPVFSYDVNGTNYTHESSTSSGYCKYKAGDRVTVFYNPKNPNKYYVEGDKYNIFMDVAVLVMGVLIIAIGVLFIAMRLLDIFG